MAASFPEIRFKAKLRKPAEPARAGWRFVPLPATASQRLPSRGQVAVDVGVDGQAFTGIAEPDGLGGHWLGIPAGVAQALAEGEGTVFGFRLSPAREHPEPEVPDDLRQALALVPQAARQWASLTPAARRDWIFWLDTAQKMETRRKRIASACDMLATGKRRVCCFDRSGQYGGGVAAPREAD